MRDMAQADLERMMEEAAERGAQKALASLGLQDEHAPTDVRELRSLLETWRDVRRTALQTLVKWFTGAILSAIALGIWIKLK